MNALEAVNQAKDVINVRRVYGEPYQEDGLTITAFLSSHEAKRPSLIEIKRFCAENFPLYMIPDRFTWFDSLPKTSTDKIDYQRLKEMR